ncbi:MAG TPA: ArsR family transcriptional regulator, partial [Candidatus Thermoplasmatota archaeon]|nr:ArsR family transcriptional regulator [Candidatus Thermoplasmatota archaeon]
PLDAGELALRARVDGVPGILRAQSLTYGGAPWRSETSFAHATPAGAWVVSRLGASGLVEPGETIVALPPRVALLLVNVTARVQTASADEPLDTRTRWDESRVGPVGATVERGQHVYLELDDPVLDLGPDAPFVLLLDAPSVRVLGAVGPVPADGWVAEAGRRRDLRGAALGLEGDVRLAPLPRDALAPGEAPAHAVSGEGRAVVDGLRSGPRVAEAAGAQATLAAALLGLALLARALLPLYSRIDKARALGHPSRRRILDLLAQAPGSTVGAICAGTGLGRAAIEHHLHVLGTHGVVAMARDGRRRRYHRRDAPPVGQEARRALTDATRRRIAGLLADGRVLTQRDLAAEAGVSKRLVCYHLARLADVGLVEPRPGLPRRYGATARLRDLMGQGDAAAHA